LKEKLGKLGSKAAEKRATRQPFIFALRHCLR